MKSLQGWSGNSKCDGLSSSEMGLVTPLYQLWAHTTVRQLIITQSSLPHDFEALLNFFVVDDRLNQLSSSLKRFPIG